MMSFRNIASMMITAYFVRCLQNKIHKCYANWHYAECEDEEVGRLDNKTPA